MIIKSMSRKAQDFLQLLEYINKGREGKNKAIFHNLEVKTDNLLEISTEFIENAQYAPYRKNGVVCYHEILSFPKRDKIHLTDAILEDIAQEYLGLRAFNAIGYAKAHLDTENPHIHFCISGNEIRTAKKLRLSRIDFKQIKQQITRYKDRKYPFLCHSKTVSHQNIFHKQTLFKIKKSRERGQTIKVMITGKISEIFSTHKDLSKSLEQLEISGIKPYARGKSPFYGVIYKNRKYRLSTLGVRALVDEKIKRWAKMKNRLYELDKIRESKERIQEKEKEQEIRIL